MMDDKLLFIQGRTGAIDASDHQEPKPGRLRVLLEDGSRNRRAASGCLQSYALQSGNGVEE